MKTKAFLALLLIGCILFPALAQTKPAAQPQTQKPSDDNDEVVKITTNLVQVDAVVTKDGKHVTNLTADDFEIYEDGKKQTITSFAYISNVRPVTGPVATTNSEKRTTVPTPGAPFDPNQAHRTLAFVVDDLGLSFESMGQVRRQLKKFIANELQPNDLVAIIRTGGQMGALQQFTTDRRILNRAVDQLRWTPCGRMGTSVFQQAQYESGSDVQEGGCSGRAFYGTLGALRFIVDAMAELPGRKSMILMSDSLPMESQELTLRERQVMTEDNLETNNSIVGTISYRAYLAKIAEKAIRASVVIYSVDTQGLPTIGITAADSFSTTSRNIHNQINTILSTRSRLLWSRREGGDMIARQTGGFQIRNSNNYQLDRIVEDQAGYYLIGYRPTDETFNRKFHHIKAKVKKSGMTLRTRFGFFGVSEEEAARTKTVRDQTNLALASPFRAQDINIEMTSFFTHEQSQGSVVRSFVYLDANDMNFTLIDGRHRASLDLYGVVFGDNGAIVEQLGRSANVSLSDKDYEYAKQFGLGITVDMRVKRPGAFQVRIAARDRTSTRIGSAGQFVVVPDLKKKRLAISGVVVGVGSDAAVTDSNEAQLMSKPGLRRFNRNSNLSFTYMLYNAADERGAMRNLVMQTRIFRDDKVIYSGPEVPIKASNPADLTRISASGAIRLAPELEPGNYYLQLVITEVGVKKPVPIVEWVDFQIEK